MKSGFVIYHANCSDGFGAAWAIWKALGETATYFSANHGENPPQNLAGKDIVIADFSYSRAVLEEMQRHASSIVVLDHHKSAQKDLEGLPFARFDMNRSGAGMAWDYFHESPRPALIDYIEDRDLWRFALPKSKEIMAAFEIIRPSFQNYEDFNKRLESDFESVVNQGSAIIPYKNAKIKSLVEKNYLVDLSAICSLADPTMQVPCVNTSIFGSEVGNLLAQSAPLAITWYLADDGKCRHSLRSVGRIDCSEIAKFWGGGGHANAAGFTTDSPLPMIKQKN